MTRARARLYAAAAGQLTWRQALHRPRRLVPPAVLAGRPPRTAGFWSPGAGLMVDPAPQSGPCPAPHLDGIRRAVGAERAVTDPGLWTDGRDGLLFLFELHGFAELARYAAGDRSATGDLFWERLVRDWLARCGRPSRPAWHPFPLSARVLAWCAALGAGGWTDDLEGTMVRSLRWQLRSLRRSVEDDIGGNHVLRNACALVVGGRCCRDPAAVRRGRAVLQRELPRQILSDGGHEERSPSYARAILSDLENLMVLEDRAGAPEDTVVSEAVRRLRGALGALTGPDGALPLLNDAWAGPPVARTMGEVHDLQETGWVVLRAGEDQVVLDVGPLCPPHLPPHAHADALSFTLWTDGHPVVVDPGTGGYEALDRAWARATRSHATVEVDGEDQCIFWGPFRASGLPEVRRGPLERRRDASVLTARHDGYRRLPDPVEHVRTFCWLPGDGLVVIDRLHSAGRHDAVSRLPLAPGGHRPLRIRSLDGSDPAQRPGKVCPYFGEERESTVLEQPAGEGPSGWILTRSSASVSLDGDRAEVRRPGQAPVVFRAL